MQLKTFEGLARLTDKAVVLEYGAGALQEKKDVARRVIPFVHVLEVEYEAPKLLTGGLLRVIMREGQARVHRNVDTFALRLTGSRRQSAAFVAELRRRTGDVEYEMPPASKEPEQVYRDVTSAEIASGAQGAMQFGTFKGFVLTGDTLSKGRKTWSVRGCQAEVETNVAANDRTKVSLTVMAQDETLVVEVRGRHEAKAREFAAKINYAAAAHRLHPFGGA